MRKHGFPEGTHCPVPNKFLIRNGAVEWAKERLQAESRLNVPHAFSHLSNINSLSRVNVIVGAAGGSEKTIVPLHKENRNLQSP